MNPTGHILVGRRIGTNAWQMPQGGINRGESPRDALFRELGEELGTGNVEVLAESAIWRSYEVPGGLARIDSPMERWRGQRQKWFLCLFRGSENEINLAAATPEFDAWRWVDPADLPGTVVAFKRPLYAELLDEFSGCIRETLQRLRARGADKPAETRLVDLSAHRATSTGLFEPEIDEGPLGITDGEVNFIEGFVHDGSIGAECGLQLMRNWGYCERHAWVSIAVEMSVLHGFCSRSATLYVDILRQGAAALASDQHKRRRHLIKSLKEAATCIICSAKPRLRGVVERVELAKAKDPTRLRAFAEQTARYWRLDCCPHCGGAGFAGGHLCRRHLIEAIESNVPVDLDAEHQYLLDLLARVDNFAWSFSWGFRGIDGLADRAALLSAIGWCSGWTSLGHVLPLRYPSSTSRITVEQI